MKTQTLRITITPEAEEKLLKLAIQFNTTKEKILEGGLVPVEILYESITGTPIKNVSFVLLVGQVEITYEKKEEELYPKNKNCWRPVSPPNKGA